MRKNKVFVSLIALLLLFFIQFGSIQAQKKQRKYFYPAPTRLLLPSDANERKEADNGEVLREHFYPIGWSRDGKFAYLVEPADEACGCYFAIFFIQDMRTDKILWEKKYEGNDRIQESLVTYWRKNRREFSDQLDLYDILVPKRFVLEKSDFVYQGDALKTMLNVNVKTDDNFHLTGGVLLQLISKQKGKKTIYEQNFDSKQADSFLDTEVAGTLLAPFEAHAAIILVEKHRGWEGLPFVTSLHLVGANLTDGFRLNDESKREI